MPETRKIMRSLQPRLPKNLWLAACALGGALLATVSTAQTVTLTDGNSTALVDVNSDMGMRQWTVQGVNQLKQQWFWYRIGNGVAAPINSISAAAWHKDGDNFLSTTYHATGFSIQVDYLLSGGGFGQADILESITVFNKTSSDLNDFHFYQYSNFDLLNTPGGDTVAMDQTMARQHKGASQIAEGIIDPSASFFEANTTDDPGSTLYRLTHEAGLNLGIDNSGVATGDVTWAFQWDLSIAANSEQSIFKDKLLDVRGVPEPTALAFFALGFSAFALRRRTHK